MRTLRHWAIRCGLFSALAVAAWAGDHIVGGGGGTSVTVSSLAGVKPASCSTLNETIIDSDSGLVWTCTDVATDAFINVAGRHTVKFWATALTKVIADAGDQCLNLGAIGTAVPTQCNSIGSNYDREFNTPHNLFIGTCLANTTVVGGSTWDDGVDSLVMDLRFHNATTTSDSVGTITITSDSVWHRVAFNIVDPFADALPTVNQVAFRPNANSMTDANASVASVSVLVACDVTEWD